MSSSRIFSLGNRYLIGYLTFLACFAPLSTDMYLPALPGMAEMLNTTHDLISFSLTSFFLVYAVSTLFWGPVSDHYGRRPVLLIGCGIYIVACAGIALTDSIWVLLILRGFQAIGAASSSAMSLAIVKDILRGTFMEKLVSFMQAAHVLAPLSAPIIGSAILLFADWRFIFWTQALTGILALSGVFFLKETRRINKGALTLGQTFKRMSIVIKNSYFTKILLIFSAMAMPFMSFLAVSTFIYQTQFGLSPQAFSIFFAMNAMFGILAPLAHVFWLSKLNRQKIITFEMSIMVLCGFLICCFGSYGPWAFFALFAPLSFCGGALRPPSTVIMMEANRGDNGIVSSMIQCCAMLFASLSMFIAPMSFWPNPVWAVGIIGGGVSLICLICWIAMLPKSVKTLN